MADQEVNELFQHDMIKHILIMTARIEGKTDAMMIELASYKAKQNGTTAVEEVTKLQEMAQGLGKNLLEELYKAKPEAAPAPKPYRGLL